jgi:hypothetical protein
MDLEFGNANEDSNEDEHSHGAGDAAIDLMKQLITLAAGVLALSATFLEKIGPMSHWLLAILALSWFALTISVLGGIQTMSAVVKSRLDGNDAWSERPSKQFASTAKYGFIVGISLFLVFAFLLLAREKPKAEKSLGQGATVVGKFVGGQQKLIGVGVALPLAA